MNIIPYNDSLSKNFQDLNIAWLEQFFYVEPKDKALLVDCKKEIIDKGGAIFFASLNNEVIVGCFALLKNSETIFELGKMAVDANFQGNNIGQQLLEYAIAYCKQMKYEKIILYSHTKLTAAIYIYRKYGFVEVPLEVNSPYKRSNIKMELSLI